MKPRVPGLQTGGCDAGGAGRPGAASRGHAVKALTDRTLAELEADFKEAGLPPFRARQVMAWVWEKGAVAYDAMTDLPKDLRGRLAAERPILGSRLVASPASRDATRKYLLELTDGKHVECVLIPAEDGRRTVCLSTQVGCPVACGFCASGLDGLERNLSAGEILDQFLALKSVADAPITNVVFMGMGEPLLNIENVARAIARLCAPGGEGGGLSSRRITISTSGIVPGIARMAQMEGQVRLSVSLHAPRDDLRTRLMPINKRYPIATLMEALRDYQARTGRLVTFEYVLLDGVNDTPRESDELAVLLKGSGLDGKVNLIPFNPVPGVPYGTPPRERCSAFAARLRAAGVATTLRVRKGADIDAACGQLRLRKSRVPGPESQV